MASNRSSKGRSSKDAFDAKVAEIEALVSAPEETAREQLKRALKDRSNFIVAKASAVIARRQFDALSPDLEEAFHRLMEDPVKNDKQCWGKNAIAKALKELGHRSPLVFLRGMQHIQIEPAYIRPEDTAITLRGACALALAGCSVDTFEALTGISSLLVDAEAPVRVDAARAIALFGAKEGLLPLRVKALVGDPVPEVIGQCFCSMLSLAPEGALDFVANFLHHDDADLRIEAVAALASIDQPKAFDQVKQFWERQTDPAVKRTVLMLLAGSPLRAAAELLFEVFTGSPDQTAIDALTAMSKNRYRIQYQEKVEALVAVRNIPALSKAFTAAFRSG